MELMNYILKENISDVKLGENDSQSLEEHILKQIKNLNNEKRANVHFGIMKI